MAHHVLVVASSLATVGGIQVYTKRFIDALSACDVLVSTVELRATKIVSKLSFVICLFRALLRHWPDLVICTNINFAPLCYLGWILFRRPYTVTIYGIEVVPIRSGLQRRALAHARFVVKLFDATGDDVVTQLPELSTRLLTVPNSIIGDRFMIRNCPEHLIARHNLSGRKVILSLSRVSQLDGENKGYERIIRAMPEVLRAVPNAHYLLAGGGDDIPRMRQLITELGLSDSTTLVGPIPDAEIVDYYNLCDVFVLPSKNEGFPAIVLLEVLACGRPVIGGAQRGAEKALLDGALGLVVPPDDVGALAQAIIEVLMGKAPAHLYDRIFLRNEVLAAYGPDAYRTHIERFIAAAFGTHVPLSGS